MKNWILFFCFFGITQIISASEKNNDLDYQEPKLWSLDSNDSKSDNDRAINSVRLLLNSWKNQYAQGQLSVTKLDKEQFETDLSKISRHVYYSGVQQSAANIAQALKNEYFHNLSQPDWYQKKQYSQLSNTLISMSESSDDITKGYPALCVFSLRGYTSLAALAVLTGADMNQRDVEGKTPFLWALDYGNDPLAKLLMDCDANITIASSREFFGHPAGRTALHTVMYRRDMIWERAILDKHPEMVNARDGLGRTPLYELLQLYRRSDYSCDHITLQKIKFLLDRGAFRHARDIDNQRPLDLLPALEGSDWSWDKKDEYRAVRKLLEGQPDAPVSQKESTHCVIS